MQRFRFKMHVYRYSNRRLLDSENCNASETCRAPDKRATCWAGHDAVSEFDVENEFKIRMSGNGQYRRTVDRFAG